MSRPAREYVVQVRVGRVWCNVEWSRGTRDYAEDYLRQVLACGGVAEQLRVKSVVARS